ncbi:MAG: dihydroorotate dehydrogenase electron transfer subunit [Candidatus Omnitrophica bacterium]|nr:dihydroorotate dehydrogenase electron transfer subunit [Candidatus Omnitrophota bacterium]
MAQIKVKIISNSRVSGNYRHLEFESGLIAKHAIAGQFVNIKVVDGWEPLLRRPLSIHSVKGQKVKVIYEILGKGTQILSTRKPGEFLDILGPLGNGFNSLSPNTHHLTPILIAGGIGVAPLVFLAEKLKLSKPLVLIGAMSKKQILCLQEFKALGCTVELATDDGSVGFKGRVTDLLRIVLEQTPLETRQKSRSAVTSGNLFLTGQAKRVELFSCGPHPMLKAVAQIAGEHKINAQLSLEEHMACGIGACLGCVVATKSGYKTVCKDGPVFSSEELVW